MLKKQQWIVVAAGAVLLFGLFIFGKFSPSHKEAAPHADHEGHTENEGSDGVTKPFEINAFINELKKDLAPSQSAYLTSLEDALTRGDLITQKKKSTFRPCPTSGETAPGASFHTFITWEKRLSWKILKKTSTLPPTQCWKN